MTKHLERLRRFESITLEEYINDEDSKLIVERILELTIQSAIDINSHIITKHLNLDFSTPQESFFILSNYGILNQDSAKDLSKSPNFRNLLAHEYLDIDDQQVFNLISKALNQYPFYIKEIKQYLASLEQEHD
jgi:uncharacterized protein YutE (UPF0331/DUF86 family)